MLSYSAVNSHISPTWYRFTAATRWPHHYSHLLLYTRCLSLYSSAKLIFYIFVFIITTIIIIYNTIYLLNFLLFVCVFVLARSPISVHILIQLHLCVCMSVYIIMDYITGVDVCGCVCVLYI